MKLYNRTKCPSTILEPLLAAAGRAVGARTSGVIVQVNQGRRPHAGGTAYRCSGWQVNGRRMVETDGGAFTIVLPHPLFNADNSTQTFYRTALHEWAHIADFQAGVRHSPRDRRQANGRRIRHDSRPCEIRANNAEKDAEYSEKLGEIKSRDAERAALADWFRSQQK